MTPLPQIISSGIAEFWETRIDDCETLNDLFAVGDMWNTEIAHEVIDPRLTSFATNVHNAALDSALEALPEEAGEPFVINGQTNQYAIGYNKRMQGREGYNNAILEARAKLSALRTQDV